jgi:hypothetical protein
MTTDTLAHTLDRMASNGLTPALEDRAKAVLMIRAAEASGNKALGMEIVRAKRAYWLDWLTMTQRKWQARSKHELVTVHRDGRTYREDRGPSKARESYVRCH